MPTNPIKKWFMLQVWRIQQVAQIITIVLLALNLSLQLYNFMNWRGGIFENAYTGVLLLMFLLAAIIWAFAFIWDMKMRMWREQMTVAIERNPYAKEKMSSKEIAIYAFFWLPVLEKLGRDDPKLLEAADILREWMKQASKEDATTLSDLKDILRYANKPDSKLLDFDKKTGTG